MDHGPGPGGRRPAPLRRFVVAERSMEPALWPGDGLVGVRFRRPRRGWVCMLPRPGCPGTWLVKRITGVPGDEVDVDGRRIRVGEGQMFVLSDNRTATRADSRTFGPLPSAGAYRLLVRVPARLLRR